jgi:hypothetical protein
VSQRFKLLLKGSLLLVLLCSLLLPVGAQTPATVPVSKAAASAPVMRDAAALATLINGMVRFTRWPTALDTVRLCVLGHDSLVERFPGNGNAPDGSRQVVAHAVKPTSDLRLECDIVYFANQSAEIVRGLLRTLVGHPVLTLGDGPDFCSDGGLFCLEPMGVNSQRFSANLDAITRSGLHINPQVLKLAKPREGSTP